MLFSLDVKVNLNLDICLVKTSFLSVYITFTHQVVYLPTVIFSLRRRPGAGCTHEEPGAGEPDSAQRLVCVYLVTEIQQQ